MDDRCWVVAREALGGEYYRLRLRPAQPFAAAPGQFVMLKVADSIDPLLRRPFSIHRMHPSGEFEVLFRVAGQGTRLLSAVHVGTRVDAIAPLGSAFPLDAANPLLVGGGVGVAPLLFLTDALLERGSRPKLLLGGRSDRDILCHDDFGCLAVPYELATEDGSLGEEGLVTRLLTRGLRSAEAGVTVFSCGPARMLAAVARVCADRQVPCWVSMEAYMACGVGACLGCVIPGTNGAYLRVCKEGPVFPADAVDWETLLRDR
ncbi:MAG: dihydroorotate dehydrogenase electron transfer subunit [Deferrisomatales bacterium]|nr:dihydroorotate dehydrogenase electron transfer subunit [Deferrisomatales bacterium]